MFVDRAAPPAGTSTGGFSKGAWRVSNANAEQLSRSARVFAGFRFGRDGDGSWTPGVVRGGRRWYLKNSFTGGAAAVGLAKQTPGTPVVGDWDNRP